MKFSWIKFFEKETKKIDEKEDVTMISKIKFFFKNFKRQSTQYQIVWTIRITLWVLVSIITIYGFFLQLFK